MQFLPELKNFLKENKLVYTVRKYKMSEAIVNVEGIGWCRRLPMGTIESQEDLLPYILDSGFAKPEDWWAKIRYFIPNVKDAKYLYRVEMLIE